MNEDRGEGDDVVDATLSRPKRRVAEAILSLAPALDCPGAPIAEIPAWIGGDDRERFAQMLLGGDAHAPEHFVARLADRGAPERVILRGLLCPAAQVVSDTWERGDCDFAELSVAAVRLQAIVEMLAARGR